METLKLKKRFVPDTNKEDTDESNPKDYSPQKKDYKRLKASFFVDQNFRRAGRKPDLTVPSHVEYISFEFFDAFNSIDFENKYRNTFGLSPIKYYEYNTKGLFAVIDEEKFKTFINDVEKFVNSANPDDDESYHHMIRFIKNFHLLTTQRIIQSITLQNYIQLFLVDNVEIFGKNILPIEASLEEYLKQR